MVLELLKTLQSNPRRLKIVGKGLLYNVDLMTCISPFGGGVEVTTIGSLRVGPLKSPGELKTIYKIDDSGFVLTESSVDFPQINFKESYIREAGALLFSNKKKHRLPVDESHGSPYDPQPLLFIMALL